MKIRKKNFWLKTILFFVIIFWMHWLYILKYPGFLSIISGEESYRYFLGWFSLLMFLGMNIFYYKKLTKYNNLMFLLWVYLILYFMQVLFTSVSYPKQSLVSTLHVGAPFLITLLVPMILVCTEDDLDFKNLVLFLDVLSFLWSIILIVQTWYFNTGSYSFLFDFKNYFTTGVTFRNDSLRLSLGSLGNLMIVYRLYSILYERKEGLYNIYRHVALGTSLYALVFIQQTRMYTLIIGIVFVVLMLCSGKSTKVKLITGFLTIVGVYVLFSQNIISDFISSFSINSDKGVSTLARIYEIQYYLKCFLKNIFFGNGLTSEVVYPQIEHGSLGTLYYVDVGIIGLFAQVGLCAVAFYVIPFCRMIKTTIMAIKYTKNWQFDFVLLVYMFFTSWTLLQIHPVQVMSFVLVFSYFERKRYKIREGLINVEKLSY